MECNLKIKIYQIRDFSIRSDGKFFRITLRSNDRLDGTGFKAFYAFEVERPTTELTPVIESSIGKAVISSEKCFKIIFTFFKFLDTKIS